VVGLLFGGGLAAGGCPRDHAGIQRIVWGRRTE
jgi:hypothetical protein